MIEEDSPEPVDFNKMADSTWLELERKHAALSRYSSSACILVEATSATKRLDAACELLYSTLAAYEKPDVEECLDPIDSPATIRKYRDAWTKTLRAYESDELSYIVSHSFCAIRCIVGSGQENDHQTRITKFWLPRLLDDCVHDRSAGYVTDDWFIAGNLKAVRWLDWPMAEVVAVRGVLECWLWCYLVVPFHENIRDPISVFMALGIDPTPMLRHSLDLMNPYAIDVVADVIYEAMPDILRNDLGMDESPQVLVLQSIARWILHRTTALQLERCFFHFADTAPEIAAIASKALDWINIVRDVYQFSTQGPPSWL
jgi:hypothetical protein